MSVESESWLAATGVISPNATLYSPQRVAEIPARLANGVSRWLRGSTVGEWAPPKYVDPQKLRDRFVHTADELPGAVDLDVVGAEWVNEVAEARQSLLDRWPGVPLRGGLTSTEPPLAHDAAQDWLGLVAVVEDPFRLLDDLEAGALLPAQLEVCTEVYPELMGVITVAAFKASVELAAKGTELPEAKELMLRLILGTEPEAPVVIPVDDGSADEGPKAKSSAEPAAESLQTVAQKAGG